jgi:hypothetical protein
MLDCRVQEAAVTVLGGHTDAIAWITAGCLHEHAYPRLPACARCLNEHAKDPLCCRICELEAIPRHCCPLILEVRLMEGVTFR